MKTTFSAFFAAILLIGCSEVLSPPPSDLPLERQAESIQLESLEAHNISENMSFLSTQNDEIVLLAYLMEEQPSGVEILEEQMFKDMIFDSTKTVYPLSLVFHPSKEKMDHTLATFVLVEMDNKNTESSIQEKFRIELSTGAFLKKVETYKLDSMIGDDDFLGLKFLKMEEFTKGKKTDIVFSGLHLFDRYKYTLHCSGQ